MEKVIISEDKILEFIEKNDKRNNARLNHHKELIKRLVDEKISLNAIYNFIFENDNSIGNKANFYKYVKRHFDKAKAKKVFVDTKTNDNEVKNIKTTTTTQILPPQKAKDILSQEFDLLSS